MAKVDEMLQAIMDKLTEQDRRMADLEGRVSGTPTIRHKLTGPSGVNEHRPDYIEYGSPEHATWLGIVPVESREAGEAMGFTIFHRSKNGQLYHLADEMTGYERHHDPEKAAKMELVRRVAVLDSGKPKVPADAPPMWEGPDDYSHFMGGR